MWEGVEKEIWTRAVLRCIFTVLSEFRVMGKGEKFPALRCPRSGSRDLTQKRGKLMCTTGHSKTESVLESCDGLWYPQLSSWFVDFTLDENLRGGIP